MSLRITPLQFSAALIKGDYDLVSTHQLLDEIQSIFSKVKKESALGLRDVKTAISKLSERQFKPLAIGILFSLFILVIPALIASWMVWQNRKIQACCQLISKSKSASSFTPVSMSKPLLSSKISSDSNKYSIAEPFTAPSPVTEEPKSVTKQQEATQPVFTQQVATQPISPSLLPSLPKPQATTLSFKERTELENRINYMKWVLPAQVGTYFDKNLCAQVLAQGSLAEARSQIANWLDSTEQAGDIDIFQNLKARSQIFDSHPPLPNPPTLPTPPELLDKAVSLGKPYSQTAPTALSQVPLPLAPFTTSSTEQSSQLASSQLNAPITVQENHPGISSMASLHDGSTSTPIFQLISEFYEVVKSHTTCDVASYFINSIAPLAELQSTPQKAMQIVHKWIFGALHIKKIDSAQFTVLMKKLSTLGMSIPSFIVNKSNSPASMGFNSYSMEVIDSISSMVQAFSKEVSSSLNPKSVSYFHQTISMAALSKSTPQESIDLLQQWIFGALYSGKIGIDEAFPLQQKLNFIGNVFRFNTSISVDTEITANIWTYIQLLQPMLSKIPSKAADQFLAILIPQLLQQTSVQKVVSLVKEWIVQAKYQGNITTPQSFSLFSHIHSLFPAEFMPVETMPASPSKPPAANFKQAIHPAWKTEVRIPTSPPYIHNFNSCSPAVDLTPYAKTELLYCTPSYLEPFQSTSHPHAKLQLPTAKLNGHPEVIQFYRDHETPQTALFGNSEYCPCGVSFIFAGNVMKFHNAEAAYQGLKMCFMAQLKQKMGPGIFGALLVCKTGEELGPVIQKIDQLMESLPAKIKELWNSNQQSYMYEIVKAKFSQDPIFASVLLSQKGKTFIYNSGDQVSNWSVSPNNGYCGGDEGKNWLGHILMELVKSPEVQLAASQTTFPAKSLYAPV